MAGDSGNPDSGGGLARGPPSLRSLIAFCVRQRVIVLSLLAVFMIVGLVAYQRLPVEAYPDVTNVQVQIITLFPGHAAEEMERLVTVPVENQMNGIPRRASMRSISIFGLSVVTIVFEDDADRVYVRQQAFERLQGVDLPSGAQASLSPDTTPVGEIFRYTLVGPPGFSPTELKSLQDWGAERKLRQVPGVVAGIVRLGKGENALDVLRLVRAKIDHINRQDLPPGVRLVPHYDRTDLINRTLHTVLKNMGEGILLVLVVLVAFLGLGNLRSATIVALVIPLSLLGSFILLQALGIPANLISMGAVDFGIIVDPSVFVIENVLRLL